MRLAPSRTRALSWGEGGEPEEGGARNSSIHPSIHATVSEWGGGGLGGNVTALKLKDRRRDATASLLFLSFVLLPSSLQPCFFGVGGGGYFFGLVTPYACGFFFWFWIYFWYPFRESVTPAVPGLPVLVPPPSSGCRITDRFHK